ncbi:MAG: phosphate acetyltransferase [bacterium]
MNLIENLRKKASKAGKTVVLPEGNDSRTLKAAAILKKEKITDVILLGDEKEVHKTAENAGADISGITVIDPKNSEKIEVYAEIFHELRKHKNISKEEAIKTVKDEIYFATMMVHTGDADGLVAGAVHSTGDTIRPSLQIIKTSPGIKTVSSTFVMIVPDCDMGEQGLFFFSDCAITPDPDAETLAEIAISTAKTAKALAGIEARVAMLSFSTNGSSAHPFAKKVKEATDIVRKKSPELSVDGEMQADTAIVPSVAEKKYPESEIAGKANILIFPDLQSGNIAYKLVQRLAGAKAVGPFLQGIAKPVNDLSRGCSVEDIVNTTAITAVQASE